MSPKVLKDGWPWRGPEIPALWMQAIGNLQLCRRESSEDVDSIRLLVFWFSHFPLNWHGFFGSDVLFIFCQEWLCAHKAFLSNKMVSVLWSLVDNPGFIL